MNKLHQLEVRRLLKELDYVKSDYEYKNEIVCLGSEWMAKFMFCALYTGVSKCEQIFKNIDKDQSFQHLFFFE